jgi:hypothetical protein
MALSRAMLKSRGKNAENDSVRLNECFHDGLLIFSCLTLEVITFLRTTPFGVLGPTIRYAAGLLTMVTCAPMLKSSATNL